MRRNFLFSVACLFVGAVSACSKPDAVVATEDIPTAGVRFINAVPDTAGSAGLILRFVDQVENNTQFRITYRNGPVTSAGIPGMGQVQYKPARAGSRHMVIFFDDTIQAVASTKIKDTTVSLTAGHNYTALLWGSARAGTMKLTFIDETVADPGSAVALRVINATPNAIDVSQYAKGGAAPATPTWANVAPYGISSYVTVPPTTASGSGIMYNVKAAGSATNLFADVQALLGEAAKSSAGTTVLDIAPIPGTAVAGSAVTLVVFPPTVGAKYVPTFATAGGAFMWDRRPPTPPGT